MVRSATLEKRLGPLRGVGEPSDVMLKLMVTAMDAMVDVRNQRDVRSLT